MPVGLPFGLERARRRPCERPRCRVAPSRSTSKRSFRQSIGSEDVEVGDPVQAAVDLRRALFAAVDPAAVLLAEPLVDIRQVDQVLVVEAGEDRSRSR